jgi:hypothetical protein
VIWIDECASTLHVPYELGFHVRVGLVCSGVHRQHSGVFKSMEEHEEHL